MRTISTLFGLIAAFAAGPSLAPAEPGIRLTAPAAYQVVQRRGFDHRHAHVHQPGGPSLGFADVAISGAVSDVGDGAVWEYRVVPLAQAFGSGCGWTRLSPRIEGGRLAATARVAAGGWYRLEVRAARQGRSVSATAEPFGVGEVLFVAGQSYAAGANAERLKVDDPQGRVVAYDVVRKTWVVANDPLPNAGAGGTIWPALGNLLLPLARVPIGFVDVALGGSSSRQWLPGEKLYVNLSEAGKAVGRFRAVLWQQGEADVSGKTTARRYVKNLRTTRDALAAEWGFQPVWLPAKSTLHPAAYNDPAAEAVIRGAIDELWSTSGFFPGPDTDILGGENRASYAQGRHLTGLGQRRAALLWFASVWALLNRPETP